MSIHRSTDEVFSNAVHLLKRRSRRSAGRHHAPGHPAPFVGAGAFAQSEGDGLMERRIDVLLVDDHPLVLEGLKAILCTYGNIAVVGTAGFVRDGLEIARAYTDRLNAKGKAMQYFAVAGTNRIASGLVPEPRKSGR